MVITVFNKCFLYYFQLLRDNQFYSSFQETDESTWIPSQLLSALSSISSHSEDIQVDLLKVCINKLIRMFIFIFDLSVCGFLYKICMYV